MAAFMLAETVACKNAADEAKRKDSREGHVSSSACPLSPQTAVFSFVKPEDLSAPAY